MFATCKLMKVNPHPEVRQILTDILINSKRVYTYDSWLVPSEGATTELRLYNREVQSTGLGRLAELFYDYMIPLKKISETGPEIETVHEPVACGPVYVHLFEKEPLDVFVGILAGNKIALKLASVLSDVLGRKMGHSTSPLKPIAFLIEKKQQEIRNIRDFSEVVELIVEDIGDQYVDWAWMKGALLDQSDEFRKFVESPSGGKVTVLAVRFRDRTYYIYKDSRIFTRNADVSSVAKLINEMQWFFDMGRLLHDAGAITS